MNNVVVQMVGAVVLVSSGLAVGWMLSSGGSHAMDDAPADVAAAMVLSEQALLNMGATIRPVETSDFTQNVRVQATVVDAPLNSRPVTTALGGVVTELHARPGARVAPGAPLVTIIRAPIPRPELALTGALLPGVSEEVHSAVAAYRNAATQVGIIETELGRVRTFTETGMSDGLPILPRQRQIDLEYDLSRAQQALANAVREIERHGFTRVEIDAVGSGALSAPNDRLWRRALASSGFWTAREDRILDALTPEMRQVPWLVGALGELTAVGRSTADLEKAVAESEELRACFVDALSLLLGGQSVARVASLAATGELDPVVVIRAPWGPPDWDVEELSVRPGQRVDGGAQVAVLHDAQEMWLRVEPIGDEVASVARAYESATAMTATPLLEGGGPVLHDLTIDRLATRGGQHERGAVAFVIARNAPLRSSKKSGSRTWGLREGLQYVLDVPARQFPKRFILPSTAIVQLGVERVVLVRDGDSFRTQPVHVEYENEEVAVVANDGSLFPGDAVCVTGAFAVSMSLQGAAAVDPHAGHDH